MSKAGRVYRVRATHDGYRRAGREWAREPAEVALTPDEVAVLERDPRISISPVRMDVRNPAAAD